MHIKALSRIPVHNLTCVLLQVCVIVDEEGTEAAAVTSVVMMRCAAVIAEPPKIKLDRWGLPGWHVVQYQRHRYCTHASTRRQQLISIVLPDGGGL